MPTVTLDTIVAERADVTALIDTAWREGYDVALVEISQAALEPQSRRTGDEPGINPSGMKTALALSIHLCCVTRRDSHELTVEAPYGPPLLTIEPEMIRVFGQLPRMPRKYWRQDDEMRVVAHMWEILRMLSEGSSGPRSGSLSLTPVQQRWLRAAASLTVHAYLRRDIFVSDLPEISIRGGRRRALSRLLKTRLMTADEFRSWLTRHQRRGKRPGEADGLGG
jgi:hypothetical protein